jgi:hypothetical protein
MLGINLTLFDVDIYAKKLGLFHKKKEKISSYLGFVLTLLYVTISLTIFIIYTVQTFKHADLQSNDSTIYSQEVPNINLNNSDLLYFAFAVEIPSSAARFIDETIYTVKAVYYDSTKNEDGVFAEKELRELKVERCKQEKFGKNYQHLFTKGEFNNSYCISNFDCILHGGFIYDKLSLIRLDIYPCKNSSENNNHCKPQEIIDQYLAGGYFSLLLKDVGLNPSNYSFPILPTLQDIYTTISKQFFRDVIIYYEITEIRTDSGIFFEDISSKRFLRFYKSVESIFLRSEESYYNGESIMGIQIRLSDNIHVQNRVYKKMHNVFATAGGYMQMLNTIFSLLIIIPNRFFYDNIIINNLFDFDKNNNRIISKTKIDHNYSRRRKSIDMEGFKKELSNNINLKLKINNKEDKFVQDSKSEKKYNPKKESQSIDKSINMSAYDKMNNASKIENYLFSNDFNLIDKNRPVFILKNKKNEKGSRELTTFEANDNYINLNLNIFDYLCLGKFKKKVKILIPLKKELSFLNKKWI